MSVMDIVFAVCKKPPVTFICEFLILSPVSECFVYAVVKPVARAQHKDQELGHSHPGVGAEGARHAWVNIGSNGKQRAFRVAGAGAYGIPHVC